MKAHPGDANSSTRTLRRPGGGPPVAARTHRYPGAARALSRRRFGDDRSDRRTGRSLVLPGAVVALPQMRAGTLKALAEPCRRSARCRCPDIPTSDEGGVPGFYMSGWFGLFAPKDTPGRRHRKAQHRDGAGARRSDGAHAPHRSRSRVAPREQQTPEGARRVSEGRDREMVADHQGGRDQGGVKISPSPRLRGEGRGEGASPPGSTCDARNRGEAPSPLATLDLSPRGGER